MSEDLGHSVGRANFESNGLAKRVQIPLTQFIRRP